MSLIRLKITPGVQNALNVLKLKYSALDESEIIKVLISQEAFSLKQELKEEFLSKEEEIELAESYQDYLNGNYTVLKSKDDIHTHFKQLDKKS